VCVSVVYISRLNADWTQDLSKSTSTVQLAELEPRWDTTLFIDVVNFVDRQAGDWIVHLINVTVNEITDVITFCISDGVVWML
jgi:hypothetical protein